MAKVKVSELNATMGSSVMMGTKWRGVMGKMDRMLIRFVPSLRAAGMGMKRFQVFHVVNKAHVRKKLKVKKCLKKMLSIEAGR